MIKFNDTDINKIRKRLSKKDLFYVGWEDPSNIIYKKDNIIYHKIEYVNRIPVAFISVYYFSKYPKAYISLAVIPEFRHKGIAFKMVTDMLKMNLQKMYGFKTWIWHVDRDNIPSQKLAIKLGFSLSGTHNNNKEFEYQMNAERIGNKMKTKQEYFVSIENAFKFLLENFESDSAIQMLKEASEGLFPGYKFNVQHCQVNNTGPLYVMAVYPNDTAIERIIDCIVSNKPRVVSKIWSEVKEWTVEIDGNILSGQYADINLNERELAAIYIHELGHVINTNSIPNRLVNVLQYEVAKSSITAKALLGDNFFRSFLSLPILNACTVDSGSSIKEEIKADKFVCSAGYKRDLITAMDKILKSSNMKKNDSRDVALKSMGSFTSDALDQIKQRRAELVESALTQMADNCPSVYLSEKVRDLINTFFMKDEDAIGRIRREDKLNFLYERADRDYNTYITEFFGLGVKSLERIDPAEIDYIFIKMNSIKTNSDKMMLVSYIHSKLDIINYYLSIIANPKLSTKYRVPYTVDELRSLHDRLNQAINTIINMKINKYEGLYVAWPDNYDG